ncbi:hypothetical protein Tco_1500476 [Tanacetum coccineum]
MQSCINENTDMMYARQREWKYFATSLDYGHLDNKMGSNFEESGFDLRHGLVDQQRSFNGEVGASTFSTAMATEHMGSSRDETQGVSASYIDLGDCTWKKALL